MNKLCALLLSLALVATCFVFLPAEANATEPNPSGTCGENITWTLDNEGTLTISGEGHMVIDYGVDGTPWYSVMDDIKTVIIEDGITSIGYGAFQDCRNLTAVTIPGSVTSIIDFAFQGCTSLTAVTIPDGVTKIGESAFYGCSSLTSITIPESVTEIGDYAFQKCDSLWHVLYKGSQGSWDAIEISKEENSELYAATMHTECNGNEITDPANKACTLCTPAPTEPTDPAPTQPEATTAPTEPAETTAPIAPTEPTSGSEPASDPTIWIIVVAAVIVLGGVVIGVVAHKKKH